jgi:hypothetical protein
VEAQLLDPAIRQRIHELRANGRESLIAFHSRQLLLVLALLMKNADPVAPDQSLTEDEAFNLGQVCLQVNALPEPEDAGESVDEWLNRPIASRSATGQELKSGDA